MKGPISSTPSHPASAFLLACLALALVLGAAGCASEDLFPAASPTLSQSPTSPRTLTPTLTPTPLGAGPFPTVLSPSPTGSLPVWGSFPGPRLAPATPIPPPLPPAALPGEVHAIILAGLDQPYPYTGRTDAIALLIYQPRLAKAALVSIPPDLFGYLPGQTMQRLSSAYPLGGAAFLQQAVEYNLGVRTEGYLVIHLDDFALLVDELGGLTVPVMQDLPNQCGGVLTQGEVQMDGALASCYARLRVGSDEAARAVRQEELLRLILQRLVQNGNLARLPGLYSLFRERIDTNLTAADALAAIPVGLRLGDPARSASFVIGPAQTTLWEISKQPPATVFLPRREEIRALIRQALEFVSRPSPLSDIVLTLEVQLTASPTPPEGQLQATPTSPRTRTPTAGPTLQPTFTPTRTPTVTPTPTRTYSP